MGKGDAINTYWEDNWVSACCANYDVRKILAILFQCIYFQFLSTKYRGTALLHLVRFLLMLQNNGFHMEMRVIAILIQINSSWIML